MAIDEHLRKTSGGHGTFGTFWILLIASIIWLLIGNVELMQS
jgi:hypothetical protein